MTTQHSQGIHARGGIRTRDPSQRMAADQRQRPRGHWDQRYIQVVFFYYYTQQNGMPNIKINKL